MQGAASRKCHVRSEPAAQETAGLFEGAGLQAAYLEFHTKPLDAHSQVSRCLPHRDQGRVTPLSTLFPHGYLPPSQVGNILGNHMGVTRARSPQDALRGDRVSVLAA